jgi:hypothetical protein
LNAARPAAYRSQVSCDDVPDLSFTGTDLNRAHPP